MGKIFMTFVGTGYYENCGYSFGDGHVEESPFIQEALLKIFKAQNEKYDRIIFFMTEKSEELNWKEFHRNEYNGKPEINGTGLEERAKAIYPEADVKLERVPDGKNEEELRQIFNIIYKSVHDEDELTLDITHGFRSLPFIFLPVINYLSTLKKTKLEGIYYGAFESRDKETNIAPIFDLTVYQNIMEWAVGAKMFADYGNGEYLKDLAKAHNATIHKDRSGDMSFDDQSRFAASIANFTDCIMTGRGSNVSDKGKVKNPAESSTFHAYRDLQSKHEKLYKKNKELMELMAPITGYVMKSVSDFENCNLLETGLAAIKWCVEKKLTQQGYTALEETITTYACTILGLDESEQTDKEIREKVSVVLSVGNKMCEDFKIKNQETYEKIIADDYYIGNPNYRLDERQREYIKKFDMKLALLAGKIKQRRNDINHYGMRSKPMSAGKLLDDLRIYAKEFEDVIGGEEQQ